MAPTYWLDLFSAETWQEFRDHGGDISGFSPKRWKVVQRIKSGDYLLCYLTGASRWVGLLEVTGDAYYDEATQIWRSKIFPSRLPVVVRIALDPEFGVPVLDMRDELTVFDGLSNPNMWSGPFRGSPTKWQSVDGEAVVRALEDAQRHPVERPLGRRTQARIDVTEATVETDQGSVTVPADEVDADDLSTGVSGRSLRVHTEIQYELLKLGSDMGFDIHVARNDVSQEWRGRRFQDIPRLRDGLPNQFDPVTNRTIELIDVLWLQGNAIIAAFEIESTTTIYSGLLRMSDLVAMQPNISIPLFLVAAEARRGEVLKHVNRPTFAKMEPPLPVICRYISFEGLRESLDKMRDVLRYLKPEWLQDVSESCEFD